MVKTGLVSMSFRNCSVGRVLEISCKANLQAIEWSEDHHVPKGDLSLAREISQKTGDIGLEIAGYGSYYRLGQGMDIRPSLDTASAMGAVQMRLWAGSRPSAEVSDKERSSLMEELSDVVSIAKTYNITLNTEWHKDTLTDTNESAIALLSEIGDSSLRTLWQPTAALTFEQRFEGLEKALPYLSYLHVYHWDERGRRPLNEGRVHWRRYLSLLDGNKDYFALLESIMDDSVEQFYEDAEVLNDLVKGE